MRHLVRNFPNVLTEHSLITGRGATKWYGGASEVLPLQKWGAEIDFAMHKRGGGGLEVLAIQTGGGGGDANSFHPLQKVLPSGGRGTQCFGPAIFPIL